MGIEKFKQARDHLRDWLDKSWSVATAAPEAKKLEEQLDWEIRTLESRPAEAIDLSTSGIDDRSDDLLNRVNTYFPSLPVIDIHGFTFVNSITTSTGSATVSYVMDVQRIGTPTALEYASRALSEYRAIQDRQNRPEDIRSLLEAKIPSLLERFDAARSAYDRGRIGQQDATAVAISARNFVDGLRGELLEKARRTPGESMSLELAVSRLFGGSPVAVDVKYEMDRRGDLIAALSDVAKARKEVAATELEGIWSRVLDHALVILSGLS